MGGQVVIQGFSTTDKTPGFYGETKNGVGNTSAASIPNQVLYVGQMTTGTATPNSSVVQIFSAADADATFGAGSELARMCYAGLRIPGVSIWAAPVTAAGGAVAATATATFGGTWTTAGTISYRINGEMRSISVATTDTPATVSAAISSDLNSVTRWPVTSTGATAAWVVTHKTLGVRGNQQAWVVDISKAPAGLTCTMSVGTAWQSALTNAVYLATGSGADTIATVLANTAVQEYAYNAFAHNDATNIGLLKTQLDTLSGPLGGILEQAIIATIGTYSAAQSLSFTTMNHTRLEQLWLTDGETHPCEKAAVFAAIRSVTEQSDPAASYDDVILPGVAPQAQKADWPSHSTLVSALNNGITPCYTTPDGYVKVVRAIQSHCNTAGTPDYSVLDVSDVTVPDFVRRDLKLYWTQIFKPANPRVSDDPPLNGRPLPPGVASPIGWNVAVTGKLRDYEQGKNFPAPIIINVDANLPVSTFDNTARRIMNATTVIAAPANHQIGVSVRQAAP